MKTATLVDVPHQKAGSGELDMCHVPSSGRMLACSVTLNNVHLLMLPVESDNIHFLY